MSESPTRRFRFAPSPNGFLHLGHALSALTNAAMAERCGGRFLLRIEDVDAERSRPEYVQAIEEDLRWLDLAWPEPARRQSEHGAEYRALLEQLAAAELVYPAFLSRGEIKDSIAQAEARGEPWPRDPDGAPLYPGSDKALPAGERRRRVGEGLPFTWRLDMAEALRRRAEQLFWREWNDETMTAATRVEADPAAWGDVVLARRDGCASYHLAVVADDAKQSITDVVRGRDLFAATAVHRLLQELLGLPQPTYLHHRLLLGPDGRKLSKSEGAMALRALRGAGVTPEAVRAITGLAGSRGLSEPAASCTP